MPACPSVHRVPLASAIGIAARHPVRHGPASHPAGPAWHAWAADLCLLAMQLSCLPTLTQAQTCGAAGGDNLIH